MSLADRVIVGDVGAAARLISRLEDGLPDTDDEMEGIYSHTSRAHIIGITGAPGVGKSTLTDDLIGFLRKRNRTVGVIAIDPTSALTGGALLGDRVRMQRHSTDTGVFIRSLATRGWVGGLARAAIGAVHVMDAMGKDIIILETVGSGQVEIDIVRATDTTIVIMTPGAGDEVQMMKAGILEAADILVVNKADLVGVDRVKTGLEAMLSMKEWPQDSWMPPVVMTEAVNDKGTDRLVEAIDKHLKYLKTGGELDKRRRERARLEILEALEAVISDCIHGLEDGAYLEKLIGEMVKGKVSPRHAAMEIAAKLAGEIGKSRRQG
jgi:LAO/AO transport system kinase